MRKLQLKKPGTLDITDEKNIEPGPGYKKLKVLYCAICRTDAKMWAEGHRDLAMPRVLGHEISAVNEETGELCTVWPGESCRNCIYCKSQRENLCEEMKILGFHNDGGFSDYILAPETSILTVEKKIPPHLLCFAEPIGCVLNGLDKIEMISGDRIIIYGGGTLGLITALLCKERNTVPLVIEKSEEKIARIKKFTDYLSIECVKDTVESDFDIAINACPEISAFSLSITKVRKGGQMLFFSGIKKNKKIETNIANLIHYKENVVVGSYGLVRQNMIDAIDILSNNEKTLDLLIEEIISLQDVPEIIENVLSEKPLKYIIDIAARELKVNKLSAGSNNENKNRRNTKPQPFLSEYIASTSNKITPVLSDIINSAQHKIDNKTKPLGSLGRLEKLAVKISSIQGDLNPVIRKKSLFVFAADHGVVEEGVSAYPADVTGEMVENFLIGGAAINVLSSCNNIDLSIIDAGVNREFGFHEGLINKKINMGTRNFALEKAMTEKEAFASIEMGMEVFLDEHLKSPIDILGLGEMGIGNTTSATAIISAITGIPVEMAAGRGTGIDDKGLDRKIEVIEKALNYHNPDPEGAMDILQKIGGYEIGGIAGAVLAAASKKSAVVLDGLISTAAGLIAFLINPLIKDYLISGHKSVEIGQKAALSFIDLEPVIDLDMRLGEGTGAALTISLADCACAIMRDMASFDEADVSRKIDE